MLPKDLNRLCRNKYVKLDGKFSPNNELIIYKIATRSHMSPTAIAFSFWSLYCLSFFSLGLLVTHLVSSSLVLLFRASGYPFGIFISHSSIYD
jgi:hypothetical protein